MRMLPFLEIIGEITTKSFSYRPALHICCTIYLWVIILSTKAFFLILNYILSVGWPHRGYAAVVY